VAALSMSAIAETEHARSEQLDNPESIYRACADMKLFNQEVLRVILLDTRYRHISAVEITKGSINESLAHPRDIFRPVIGQSAYAFVLVHNLWVATHRLCWTKPLRGMRRVAPTIEAAGSATISMESQPSVI
jgi:RadC-like JAB domain